MSKINKLDKKIRQWISIALLCTIMVPLALPMEAKAVRKEIRVAVWLQGGRYLYDGSDVSGYDVQLIETIAQKCNWNVKYVYVADMYEALHALDDGNVDLITSVERKDEWVDQYLFGSLSTGWEYMGLIKLEERTDIIYQDIDKISSCTIGYLENYDKKEKALSYLNSMYGEVALRSYPTKEKLQNALTAGEIDLMVLAANEERSGEGLVDRFLPQAVYYITGIGNTELMNQIDLQLANLTMSDPSYLFELQKKYFPNYVLKEYTKTELDYIESQSVLKVGVPEDRKPISYYDEKTGKYVGIAIDLMEIVAEKSGLTFEYVPFDSELYVDQALMEGDYDLIAPAVESSYYENKDQVCTTNTLLDTAITIAVRKGTDVDAMDQLKIGVAKEFANLGKYMNKSYPNTTIIVYDTPEDVLDAANKGEVTAILNSVSVWSYLMQNPKYKDYDIVTTISVNLPYYIALRRDTNDDMLLGILDKTINLIDESEKDSVLAKYTTGEIYVYTWQDKVEQNLPVILVGVLLFLLLFVFIIQRSRYYQKLRKNNQKLLEANEAKNEFLSRMSHEIRTPMNAILGFAVLGKEDPEDAGRVAESFGKIESSGEFLLGIINDILDMSRIENSNIELHEEFIYQPDFLESVVTMIQPIADRESVELVYDFSHTMPVRVKADRLRLQQICINLLNNAVKFSEEGSQVEWLTEDEQVDENHIRIKYTIRDYGCGMSEEFQRNLFVPFNQEHNKFSDTHVGSGLGLAIVKNIIDQMGGTIQVMSKLGKGTEFIVELVREMENMSSEELQRSQNKEKSQAKEDAQVLTNKRVLLVEDNEINREVAVMILERYGMHVATAENGAIAVEMVKEEGEHGFDIVLMDIHMPVMNGLDAARAIRSLELLYAAKLPIVAMTANTFEDDKKRSKEAGMNAHLAKPIDRNMLFTVLMEYCGNQEE